MAGDAPPPRRQEDGPPDAFKLFCAFHLGITADDTYQKPTLDGVARRYGMPVDEVQKLLKEYRIDQETIRKARFDLEAAQMDIRVAPAGISRTEIARELYDWYLDTIQE